MELKKLIDQYLEFLKNNSYTERTILRYDYLLGIFYDYLNKNKINDITLISYLNGIDPDDILNSAKYYITKGASSEDTITMYICVLREFFKYIKHDFSIGNDDLIKSFGLSKRDENSFFFRFKSFIDELLNQNEIKPSTQGIPFSDEQVRLIVQYCNENLSASALDRNIEERDYNRCVKSLAVKLIAYLGISVEVINNVQIQHIDLKYGTIIISGYKLHLPYWLRQQFSIFIDKSLRKNDIDTPLLALYNGKIFSQPSILGQFISTKLKYESDIQNPYSIISLAKYAIIQLIDAGLDRDTIIELTGYKDEIFDSCKQIVERVDISIKSKQIDIALKQLSSYDFL